MEEIRLIGVLDSGEEIEWEVTKQKDNIYLFSKTFDLNYTGCHKFQRLEYVYEGVAQEIILSDIAITASFEINTDLPQENVIDLKDYSTEANTEDLEVAIQDAVQDVQTYNISGRTKTGDVIVVVDPGHDSMSPGAYYNGLHEEDLTLKIAKYFRGELKRYTGIQVYLTRESGECPAGYIKGNHNESVCLEKRVKFAAEKKADLLLSFHLNSAANSSAN